MPITRAKARRAPRHALDPHRRVPTDSGSIRYSRSGYPGVPWARAKAGRVLRRGASKSDERRSVGGVGGP
jgi:hypothetical protein